MKTWKSALTGAIAGLLMGISGASALELLPTAPESGVPTPAIVGQLMEPINPFVSGQAGNTTSIQQIGSYNAATSAIEGHSSASLIDQSGSRNRAVQAIDGHNSALLLVQGGSNNSVVQASRGDNNFQLVGVSGNNNNVGYVQVGSNLAGVLDVRNSVNTNVVAIQTPSSGNFMMPSGLNGLSNANVVIVPGRMYVLPNRRAY
ncbi:MULTISPECIES: hypothetical protein [Georhizobium]|jgi:hypothetical protein|nr:hypothetical protein [Georhizobium profundi]